MAHGFDNATDLAAAGTGARSRDTKHWRQRRDLGQHLPSLAPQGKYWTCYWNSPSHHEIAAPAGARALELPEARRLDTNGLFKRTSPGAEERADRKLAEQ